MMLSFPSCKEEQDGVNNTQSTAPIETTIPTDTGADTTVVAPIPDVPDTEDSAMITGNELLNLIRTGTIAAGGDYAITDGEGLIFDRKDDGKTYDLKNAVIRIGVRSGEAGIAFKNTRSISLSNVRIAVYGGTAIDTSRTKECNLSNVHITGNAETAFSLGGTGVRLNSCTVSSKAEERINNAVVAIGKDITVLNCNLENADVGVLDKSENGAVIENTVFSSCHTAVQTITANTVIWYNTVKNCVFGVKASDVHSELSAGEGTVYNVLVAMNNMQTSDVSVVYENLSNSVLLRNTLGSAKVSGCTNVYVNENGVSGVLTLQKNDYMIANGNECGVLEVHQNTNVNGDNVTDLSARMSVGANEELLPHINKEQFVGMTRKTVVRDGSSSRDLSAYLSEQMRAQKMVIVPPGAYTNLPMETKHLSDVTIYAYGVLSEMFESTNVGHAWQFTGCNNIAIKGMFFSTAIYPHTQGTVTNKWTNGSVNCIAFVADPGYHKDFTAASGKFTSSTAGHYFEPDSMTGMIDITSHVLKNYDASTGLNTLGGLSTPIYNGIYSGCRVAFRSGSGDGGLRFDECSEMKIEDVTVMSAAGFAEADYDNDVAPLLHRYAVTAGPAPVLDSTKTYDASTNIIWKDSYGRLRSAAPLYSTCDATHSTNARVGIQAISCLLENMNDDGGNINAHYSVLYSYDAMAKKIAYTTTDVLGYNLFCADFRAGDTVLLYTMNGKYVGTAKTITATEILTDNTRAVYIDSSVSIPVGEKIVVQNASASGKDFLWDNVVVRESNANGLRIKAPGGVVENCTFDNVRCAGVKCTPEYNEWPECGYTSNVKIVNNLFEGLARSNGMWEDWDNRAGSSPITIRVNEADNTRQDLAGNPQAEWTYSSDMAYCMHKNIEISGNVFRGNYGRYEISLSGVTELMIKRNVFEQRHVSANLTATKAPILILTGNGIEISNNTYPSDVLSPIENRRDIGVNISGSDLV